MYLSCRKLEIMQLGKEKFWFIRVNPGAFEPVSTYILGEEWIINSRSGIQIRYRYSLQEVRISKP